MLPLLTLVYCLIWGGPQHSTIYKLCVHVHDVGFTHCSFFRSAHTRSTHYSNFIRKKQTIFFTVFMQAPKRRKIMNKKFMKTNFSSIWGPNVMLNKNVTQFANDKVPLRRKHGKEGSKKSRVRDHGKLFHALAFINYSEFRWYFSWF